MAKPPWGPNNLQPAHEVLREATEKYQQLARDTDRVVVSDRLMESGTGGAAMIYFVLEARDGSRRETFGVSMPSNAGSGP